MKENKISATIAGIVSLAIIVGLSIFDTKLQEDKVQAFDRGEVLTCFGTLKVAKEPWSLYNYKLTKEDVAGYIDIRKCESEAGK